MFKSLSRMILLSLSFTIVLCFTLVAVITYAIVKQNVYENNLKLTLQYASQQNKKCQLYMKLIEETSRLVVNNLNSNGTFMDFSNYETVARLLDGMIATNANIASLSLYTGNEAIYTTSNISNPPTLAELAENNSISDFRESSETILWMVRRNTLTGFYTSLKPELYTGFYTMITKLYDSRKQLLGYLLIDTNISSVFSFYNTEDSDYLNVGGAFILAADGSFLSASYNRSIPSAVLDAVKVKPFAGKEEAYLVQDEYLIVFKRLSPAEDRIAVVFDLEALYSKLRFLKAIFLLVFLFVSALCFFMFRLLTSSVTRPLTSLYIKMQKPLEDGQKGQDSTTP